MKTKCAESILEQENICFARKESHGNLGNPLMSFFIIYCLPFFAVPPASLLPGFPSSIQLPTLFNEQFLQAFQEVVHVQKAMESGGSSFMSYNPSRTVILIFSGSWVNSCLESWLNQQNSSVFLFLLTSKPHQQYTM